MTDYDDLDALLLALASRFPGAQLFRGDAGYGEETDVHWLRAGGVDHQADIVAVWVPAEGWGWLGDDLWS